MPKLLPAFLVNRSTKDEQVAVHVRCNLAGKIKREMRDGRETIILPSYAAKADTVLNGTLYPREELQKSYAGLNRTPAPLGHPLINGNFVAALDPEALARNYVFAWNENPRWDGERIALDVVIDVARAKESEGGKQVLNAIDAGTPISTSTGLLCMLEYVEGAEHDSIAREIVWDHVAILLDEEPAISTGQGVGIFVNSSRQTGKTTELKDINSTIEEEFDREIEWAAESIWRAVERREEREDDRPAVERIKSAIMKALGLEREPSANRKEADMSKEQIDALSAKVDALSESITPEALGKTIGDVVANAIKPLTDNLNELQNAQKAKDDAELATLREKIVKANLMDEEAAGELTLNAARALAKKAEPKKAAALNGKFDGAGDEADQWDGYTINQHVKTEV